MRNLPNIKEIKNLKTEEEIKNHQEKIINENITKVRSIIPKEILEKIEKIK